MTNHKVAQSQEVSWSSRLPSSDKDECRQIESFYAHLTLAEMHEAPTKFVERLLQELPLRRETRKHLENQNPHRLLIYRELVRGNFRSTIETAIPRARARMEAEFEPVFSRFLAHVPMESHILRDIIPGFLKFGREEGGDDLLPFLWELAELEALRLIVASHPSSEKDEDSFAREPDLSHGILFSEAVVLVSFDHAVHLLPEDIEDRSFPEKRPTHLLSYRDENSEVRYMVLTPLASSLVERLLLKTSLGAAISDACKEQGHKLNEEVLSGCAQILSELSERRAIVGILKT